MLVLTYLTYMVAKGTHNLIVICCCNRIFIKLDTSTAKYIFFGEDEDKTYTTYRLDDRFEVSMGFRPPRKPRQFRFPR